MKIFDKRPLSLILCIMLGSFVFSSFYDNTLVRIISILLSIIIFISTFISYFKNKIPTMLIRVISISSIVAVLFSTVYFDMWFKAYERYESCVCISGEIENLKTSKQRTEILLRTTDIDDTPLSEYRLLIYVDSEEFYGFSIGSKVELVGKIEGFTDTENFDAESYYTSHGISGAVNEVQEFSIKEIGEYPLNYKIKDFRQSIARRIISNSNEDSGGLLCALLLGEKDYLPIGTRLDFSRIGISHVLALSGMHLAILSIALTKFLMFLRVGKKSATLSMIFFTIAYMILTGLSLSVMRAGFMLIISSVLFLIARSRDSMTSLFMSVFIICLIQPYAIFDMSLWLSAFATLGIVVMSEYQSQKYSKPSILRWIITSFLASFFAIAATFAITTLKFDGTSLLAPISTLIFSLLVEVFVYIGLVLLVFGSFILIKYPFIFLGNLIVELAEALSDFDWVYISTNFAVTEILSLIFSALFFSFFILEIKRKKTVICALAGILGGIFCLSATLTYAKLTNDSITFYNRTEDRIVFTEDGDVLAIDVASYSRGSAYSFYADIANNNLTKIDKYVVTHYSYYLEDAISTLCETILIRELYLPAPQNPSEERIYRGLLKFSSEANLKINTYFNEDRIEFGNSDIIPLCNYSLDARKKNMFTVIRKDKVYTYLSGDILDGETKNMASEIIAGSHTIILGRHKTGNFNFEFSKIFNNLDEIISSEENISIDKETLKFYFENGTKITFPKNKHLLYVE